MLKDKDRSNTTAEEMKLINSYCRHVMKESEVYTFSVVLCDNDIDRDFECFTNEALEKLRELYVGKTGILDHSNKSANQTARVFSAEVEKVPGRLTKTGEEYYRLKARAYMPRIDKNKDFISEIETGIKKEVSIGCAVSKKYCSICGASLDSEACNHEKGKYYEQEGKASLCYTILDEPTDAYEWSFVAVPAQVNAGVIKTRLGVGGEQRTDVNAIIKYIRQGKEICLNSEQAFKVGAYLREVEKMADMGKAYRNKLEDEIVEFSSVTEPSLDSEMMTSVCKKLSSDELKEFHKFFSDRMSGYIPAVPQLFDEKSVKEQEKTDNIEFKI